MNETESKVGTGRQPCSIPSDLGGGLRFLFDEAADGLFIADSFGRLMDVNSRASDLTGYGAAELLGMTMAGLIQAEEGGLEPGSNEPHASGDGLMTREGHLVRKDGTLVSVQIRLGNLPDGSVLWRVNDTTECRRAGAVEDRRTRELASLHALSLAVGSSLSLDQTSSLALQGLMDAVQPDLAFLFLREGERLALRQVLPPEMRALLGAVPEHRVGECLCGLAVTDGRPVYSTDVRVDIRCTMEECKRVGIRSFAALPLVNGHDILGVIGLGAVRQRCFQNQSGFLETLAHQVSMALSNARLYEAARQEIAERQKVEEEQARLSAILESTSDLVSTATPDGRLTYLNRAGRKMAGWDRDESLGGKVIADLHPAWALRKIESEGLPRAEAFGSWEGETAVLHRDGHEIPVSQVIIAHRAASGTLEYFSTIVRDITERKRGEQSFREIMRRYREIFDGSRDGFVVVDNGGRILDANRAYCDMLGYTLEELRLVSSFHAITPERWHEWEYREIWQNRLMRQGYTGLYEKEYFRKDGTVFPVELQAYTVRSQDGKVAYIWGIVREISERKRAEDAIKLNEARLECLLRISEHPADSIEALLDFALNEAIHLTGSEIGYIYFYDEKKKELTLNNWSRSVMSQCAVADPQRTYRLEETGLWGEAVHQEKPIMVNDFAAPNPLKKGLPAGHAPLRKFLTAPVISQGRVMAVVGVANKQTDYNESDVRQLSLMMDAVWKIVIRKKADEEREKLQAQLLHAQKLESVGRLAGGVAHDFNNILGVILGRAELAMLGVSPKEPIHRNLKEIKSAAERSAELTRKLLAFARKQTVAPRVVDLNETVAGMLKMLQRLIGEDIHLLWKPAAELRAVRFDPSQIDQILANLCVNARDAITGVGKLTIETGNMDFDEAYCAAHPGFLPGQYVMLAVSDDGRGMDKEILGHIFEPFFTTKEAGEGTGLGLATVYGIVKQNAGFINVYSEPGKGSTFRIYLPRFAGQAAPSTVTPSPQPPRGKGRGETVLLVEDEEDLLAMSRMMLELLGYVVLPACTPSEALGLARAHPHPIELLITDVVMPEMNGRELARSICALSPGIKCLFMSGYTANVIAHHGVLNEGVHFIQKPFSMNDLAAKVREALEIA